MESIQDMSLIGYYHFSSKDKTKIYYIVQVLYTRKDISTGDNRSMILDIFVDDAVYNSVINKDIGDTISVSVAPNLATGKVNYKIVNY